MFKKPVVILVFAISVLIILLTTLAYWLNGYLSTTSLVTERLGHYGDFVGGFLGTVLTIVATLYIINTYHSQKEELELQRNLLAQQQFESTFFNLLTTHRELKKDLKISGSIFRGQIITADIIGVDVIETVIKDLKKKYNELTQPLSTDPFVGKPEIERQINKFNEIDKNDEIERLKYIYNFIFHQYQNQISHYCRNIYHILKFLRKNEQNDILLHPKNSETLTLKFKEYANVFQSQLNVDEQLLIFYDFIYFNGETKGIYSTMNLLNHYKFLENVGEENLLKKKHSQLYTFKITHKQ